MTMPMFVTRPNFTIWDSAKKAAGVTLSGGNLTATLSSGGGGGGSNVGSISGVSGSQKRMFSIQGVATGLSLGEIAIGFAQSGWANWATVSGTSWLGNTANSVSFFPNYGIYLNGALQLAWTPSMGIGDTIDCCLDMTNLGFYARKNGGNWNNSGTANPATNTGAISVAAFSGLTMCAAVSLLTNTDSVTGNFGASAFPFALPSGFTGIS